MPTKLGQVHEFRSPFILCFFLSFSCPEFIFRGSGQVPAKDLTALPFQVSLPPPACSCIYPCSSRRQKPKPCPSWAKTHSFFLLFLFFFPFRFPLSFSFLSLPKSLRVQFFPPRHNAAACTAAELEDRGGGLPNCPNIGRGKKSNFIQDTRGLQVQGDYKRIGGKGKSPPC